MTGAQRLELKVWWSALGCTTQFGVHAGAVRVVYVHANFLLTTPDCHAQLGTAAVQVHTCIIITAVVIKLATI